MISARDRRAVMLGGTVLVIAFVLVRGIPLWLAMLDRAQAEAARETRALADARALVAAAPMLRDSLDARRARYLAMAPDFIASASPDAAVARLSGIVSSAASTAGVALSSLSLSADTASRSGFGRPMVRGEARGDISGLSQFPLLVEMGPPLLRVAQLTVTQPDVVGGTRAEELRITFVIDAIALPVPARRDTGGSR